MHPYNQELYNRILTTIEGIINQYIFKPANEMTRNSVHSRVSGYLHPLQAGKEITSYAINVNTIESTLEVSVAYKEPNLANAIYIDLSLGPTRQDRFDRAMKGV